ncbi:hypothetical protein ACFRAQ_34700 [Nocardia sp. NPDC056611]|uniref:hypothetical protein n=1 Tax=Nocardia sp. NPDC056611 TaxID=3345877 RepID=UPI0036735645
MKNVAALQGWAIRSRAAAWLAGVAAQIAERHQATPGSCIDERLFVELLTDMRALTEGMQLLAAEVGSLKPTQPQPDVAHYHVTNVDEAWAKARLKAGRIAPFHQASGPNQEANRRIEITYTTSEFGEVLAAARVLTDHRPADIAAHVAYAALAYSRQIVAAHNHNKHEDEK